MAKLTMARAKDSGSMLAMRLVLKLGSVGSGSLRGKNTTGEINEGLLLDGH